MSVRKAKHGWILTIIFTVISLLYISDRTGVH